MRRVEPRSTCIHWSKKVQRPVHRQRWISSGTQVVTMLGTSAQKSKHSGALSQLASRIAAVMKFGAGARPFAKVKGLITELINRLQSEASSEANRKSYCDEETSKATEEK